LHALKPAPRFGHPPGDKRACVIIPAYNSQATIAQVVNRARIHTDQVVVVNDGSTDATARRAAEAGARVMGGGRNRGKGHALALAFRYVLQHGFETAITLDADLQHDPAAIPAFLRSFEATGADLIIGNRMHQRQAIPRVRYVPNLIGTRCFSWLTGQTIRDSQCGFRLYSRRLMASLPMLCDGFAAESDLLLRAGRHGFRIEFIPIEVIYHPLGHTAGRSGRSVGGYPGNCRSFYRPVRDTYDICINFLKNWFWQKR
jgi:glycosyltransferase involved in cell wall biosynthesis